jgi:hypothetical protein
MTVIVDRLLHTRAAEDGQAANNPLQVNRDPQSACNLS